MNQPGTRWGLLTTLGLALGLLAGCTSLAENIPLSPVPATKPATTGMTPGTLAAPTTLTGTWGGKAAGLTIDGGSTMVEFDCAHGTIEGPLVLDTGGSFTQAGTFTQEQGTTAQDQPAPQPARYSGLVSGNTLTLTVSLPNEGRDVGTFTLTAGQPAELKKCL